MARLARPLAWLGRLWLDFLRGLGAVIFEVGADEGGCEVDGNGAHVEVGGGGEGEGAEKGPEGTVVHGADGGDDVPHAFLHKGVFGGVAFVSYE